MAMIVTAITLSYQYDIELIMAEGGCFVVEDLDSNSHATYVNTVWCDQPEQASFQD